MQITMSATTAAIGVENQAITTAKVQVLPSWAPPIQYLKDSTTGPFQAMLAKASTGGLVYQKQVHVYAFGRKATLYSGMECVTLSRAVTRTATKKSFLTLTYRALGEVTRP